MDNTNNTKGATYRGMAFTDAYKDEVKEQIRNGGVFSDAYNHAEKEFYDAFYDFYMDLNDEVDTERQSNDDLMASRENAVDAIIQYIEALNVLPAEEVQEMRSQRQELVDALIDSEKEIQTIVALKKIMPPKSVHLTGMKHKCDCGKCDSQEKKNKTEIDDRVLKDFLKSTLG